MTGTTPRCFGSEWDPKDVDCTGGYNPAYAGEGGTKIQPRCDFFEPCKGRVSLKKIEELQKQGQIIRPEALVQARRAADQVPQTTSPGPTSARQEQPAAPPAPPVAQPIAEVPSQHQHMIHPMLLPLLMGGGLPFMPPGSPYYPPTPAPREPIRRESLSPSPSIHPYLAVSEPRRKGERLIKPLGREMARAGLKAVFQTAANFFDFVPFGSEEDE
jgi:hypothetical protein